MESKEAIQELYKERSFAYDDKLYSKHEKWQENIEHYDNIGHCLNVINKDLYRLEKYEKAKALIKKKNINVLNLLHFSRYYPKNSCLSIYNKNVAIELTQDEFDFILEVFK